MTWSLVLTVRFLNARYHGLTDNGRNPEWPPSPFRLFQALVAGNAVGGAVPTAVRTALLWLEAIDAPMIDAPQATAGGTVLTYVLNNTSDSDPSSRAEKVFRPTLLNGDRLVRYAWAFDRAERDALEHASTVTEAVRHIRCLGWGIDLAIGYGEIVDAVPDVAADRVRYSPTSMQSAAGVDLRVPVPGSLLSLERTHADFLRRYETPGITRLESAAAIYQPQRYVTGTVRPSVAFRLVNADGDTVSLRHQLIAPLVGMVRALAQRDHVVTSVGQDAVDRHILGHPKDGSTQRVSILPLPTIRSGPTDGRIRRIMLTQPCDTSDGLCGLLGQLLDGQPLTPKDGDTRFGTTYLERIGPRGRDGVLPYYTDTSRVWASVTPVLLPGYDDRRQHRGDHQKRLARAAELAGKAMTQAGIEMPARVELSRVPFWTGSLHAGEYQPREKLSHYPRYHVRLCFDQPVTGPLAIGAGRHAGFGVLAACDQ